MEVLPWELLERCRRGVELTCMLAGLLSVFGIIEGLPLELCCSCGDEGIAGKEIMGGGWGGEDVSRLENVGGTPREYSREEKRRGKRWPGVVDMSPRIAVALPRLSSI